MILEEVFVISRAVDGSISYNEVKELPIYEKRFILNKLSKEAQERKMNQTNIKPSN
jgi:hypothetical protein